jgi:predicted lactoylglutathione lyase
MYEDACMHVGGSSLTELSAKNKEFDNEAETIMMVRNNTMIFMLEHLKQQTFSKL